MGQWMHTCVVLFSEPPMHCCSFSHVRASDFLCLGLVWCCRFEKKPCSYEWIEYSKEFNMIMKYNVRMKGCSEVGLPVKLHILVRWDSDHLLVLCLVGFVIGVSQVCCIDWDHSFVLFYFILFVFLSPCVTDSCNSVWPISGRAWLRWDSDKAFLRGILHTIPYRYALPSTFLHAPPAGVWEAQEAHECELHWHSHEHRVLFQWYWCVGKAQQVCFIFICSSY